VASGVVSIAVARAGVAGAEPAPVEAALEVARVGAASGTLVRPAVREPVHLPTETPPSLFLKPSAVFVIPAQGRCPQHAALRHGDSVTVQSPNDQPNVGHAPPSSTAQPMHRTGNGTCHAAETRSNQPTNQPTNLPANQPNNQSINEPSHRPLARDQITLFNRLYLYRKSPESGEIQYESRTI